MVTDPPSDSSGSTVPTEQQTPVGVEDSTGTQVNPATESSLTSTLSREIASWTAGTLAVEQQTPVGIEDSTGTQVDPRTDEYGQSTGSADVAANGDAILSPTVPGRPEAVTIFTSGEAAHDVSVQFGDGAGNYINRTFSSSSGVVFERVDVASDDIQITITDTSGGSNNSVSYRAMVI